MTESADLSAIILHQARHGEQIAEQAVKLTALENQVKEALTLMRGIQGTQSDQAVVIGKVEDSAKILATLVKRFDALFPPGESDGEEFYQPAVTARWWELKDAKREEHLTRVRKWVKEIYLKEFGHLAVRLPECWEQHDFCLTLLDVMAELHGCLWLQPIRTQGMLSGQGELLSRLFPALAALLSAEAKNCAHASKGDGWGPRPVRESA